MKYVPEFDKGFSPISEVLKSYRKDVKNAPHETLKICVERNKGYNYVFSLDVYKEESKLEISYRVVERMIKAVLWVAGGYKIYICGSDYIFDRVKKDYSASGARAFDVDFMSTVYERPFEVVKVSEKDFPKENKCSLKIGGHLEGCRIGFDAGGSDRKVSAVIDGKVVYSEEVVWHPKLSTDWRYQYDGIKTAFLTAASKMPRVDAVGVSSAGVYIDNKIMVASLFLKIPEEDREKHVKTMYLDIAKELGYKIDVENDGDVTALAGAMALKENGVLGIAMGTSEAVGYINKDGNLNGWISELAFAPVDMNPDAMQDEWSGDIGCGVKYFSQDGVIKLAESAGIKFDESLSPAEKLKVVQKMLAEGDGIAKQIFDDIGTYLGYTLAFYSEFYDINVLLLLGRVTSGAATDLIVDKAKKVLADEYPELKDIKIIIPDESIKRVGQSIAAASLTEI
ncbi:MAG: ROK family protein [Clostridia bacterium]|nr:ROK family protein [Clostridia bacterium]